ncbi:hypothetical protein BaRGS_00002642 [Batillaria attramentaria]|uniref:PH domain-containing protein n=1 Tax=Batillaria attramentaria TaxID=370345 RepID=A0ABD0M2Z5_9CAEN
MAHTCRGTINLANAIIHTEDSTTIIISNGGAQTFHLKATSEVERQKWVTALELAKSEAIKMLEAESDEEERQQPDKNELQLMIGMLASKLEDLNTCNDLIAKHGSALQKTLSELEQVDDPSEAASKLKAVNERATLFRITSNAMINACNEFHEVASQKGKRWQKLLQHEHEQRLKLEDMVEQLAKDQISLEKKARMTVKHGDGKLGESVLPVCAASVSAAFTESSSSSLALNQGPRATLLQHYYTVSSSRGNFFFPVSYLDWQNSVYCATRAQKVVEVLPDCRLLWACVVGSRRAVIFRDLVVQLVNDAVTECLMIAYFVQHNNALKQACA